jgi:quercetin dioxygenase-like cupin family protein
MKRRDFLASSAALPSALLQQGITHVDTKKDGATLKSAVVSAAKVTPEGAAPGAKAFVEFNGPTGQLAALAAGFVTLEPGAKPHPPHQHPEEEIMIVGEGAGEYSINGVVTQVKVGDMLYVEGNVLHGVLNTGKTRMTFYFMKMQGKNA